MLTSRFPPRSIRQPWADLILMGDKDVENRSRRTHFCGTILVHASAKRPDPDLDDEFQEEARRAGFVRKNERWEFDLGAILGMVDIVDCVEPFSSPWFSGPYGWGARQPASIRCDNSLQGCRRHLLCALRPACCFARSAGPTRSRAEHMTGAEPERVSPELDEREMARLSPVARSFRLRFAEQLSHVAHREEFTDRFEFVIPPADPEVGELRVWDDGDELTISVGETHHWHVLLDRFDDQLQERRPDLLARAAVREIQAFLEGRTILRLTRRNGRMMSSMIYDPERARVRPPTNDDTDYLWTGRRALQ